MTTPNAGEATAKLDHSCVTGGNVKWYRYSGNSLAISFKTKHAINIWTSNCTPGPLSQRNEELNSQRNLYMNVYNFIHSSKKTGNNPMSFNGKYLKSLVYTYHKILLNDNKELLIHITT